jgi:hypothetical protein
VLLLLLLAAAGCAGADPARYVSDRSSSSGLNINNLAGLIHLPCVF